MSLIVISVKNCVPLFSVILFGDLNLFVSVWFGRFLSTRLLLYILSFLMFGLTKDKKAYVHFMKEIDAHLVVNG